MSSSAHAPTRLIEPEERAPIEVEARTRSPRLRRWRVLLALGLMGVRLVLMRCFGKRGPRVAGRLVCERLQRLGATWIKIAQFMTMRVDLLSFEFRDEMTHIQDQARAFPFAVARACVERELGASLEHVFEEFEEQPFAAASIGQVHRARLREGGTRVAVKIRRPDVEEIARKDLALLDWVCGALQGLGIAPQMRWLDLVEEFRQLIQEELDYRYEVTNLRRMRRVLKRHGLHVPRAFPRHSTSRVLVMELVAGVPMTDYLRCLRRDPERVARWCSENEVRPEVVGRRLFASFTRQLLEENLFHGDLHPGNIILLRRNRIALIDFGSVGSMESEFRRKYALSCEAVGNRAYAKAVDITLLFSLSLPTGDLTEVKAEAVRRYQAWERRTRIESLPFDLRSLQSISDEQVRIFSRNGVWLNWDFLRAGRSWMTLDASFRALMPGANVVELMRRYFKGKDRRDRRRLRRTLRLQWMTAPNPLRLAENLHESTLLRGSILRRLARVFDASASRVDLLAATVVRWTLVGLGLFAFVSLLAYLDQRGADWAVGWIPSTPRSWLGAYPALDRQVWLVLLLFVGWSLRTLVMVGRRFAEEDARTSGT